MKHLEHKIQSSFFQWIYWKRRDLHPYIFAIPNGELRSKAVAIRLKKEGLKAGVSDIFLAKPTNKYHGLWMEFKAAKNKLSPVQEEFMNNMLSQGYECAVVRSLEEALIVLEKYLNG